MMEQTGDWLSFMGRWHPLWVHLPIGVLIVSFLLAFLIRWKRYANLGPAVPFLLAFGTLSAAASAITGYFLSLAGGYDKQVLDLHQWLGIAVVLVSAVVWALYHPASAGRRLLRRLTNYRFAIFSLAVVLLSATGHYGGTLTHGSGYMTSALPAGIGGWLLGDAEEETWIVENVQEAQAFEGIIQPILSRRCQSCHGAKKQEGGLALHHKEGLLAGGDGGAVMVAGQTDESELYARLILPLGDEKRMPPKGRTPIADDEIVLIAWWISQGAPFGVAVKDIDQPVEIQPVLARLESGGADDDRLPEPSAPPAEAVQALQERGIAVMPVAQGSHFLMVSMINDPAFGDADAEGLLPLGDHIVQLRLGGTAITDRALGPVAQLSALQRLHLENTAVTDAGLEALKGCQHLRYLNLTGTAVGDAGLMKLVDVPSLTNVYLFGTKVTPASVMAAQRARPSLAIDTGGYVLPIEREGNHEEAAY